jgi:peptidoglycan/LPS O-acetylase OafA/YrhL
MAGSNTDSASLEADPSRTGHRHRIKALDGLRGIAALIVVFHHILIASSTSLANIFRPTRPTYPTSGIAWLVARTPIHIVWAGPEMVTVFFVLSGYVLALPAAARGTRWFDASYYPRRFVRLYLPAWAALLVGVTLHELHTHRIEGLSWWLNDHAGGASVVAGLRDATLVHQGSAWSYTSVLWSMNWEVRFSLLLPLFLWGVVRIGRSRPLSGVIGVACLAICYLGYLHHQSDLRYLPIFILGSLLAFEMDHLRVDHLRAKRVLLPVFGVVSACLITQTYMWSGGGQAMASLRYLGTVLGACTAVWLAVVSPTATRVLSRRISQWLGTRSYSLYLVHEPIVVALAFAFGRSDHVWLLLLTATPLSLVAAELFWRFIEGPAITLAKFTGNSVRRRFPHPVAPARV